MKIDVVMLTKDSEYILKKCLNSIYKNVPVNNLIVIDGFSKDNTLSILEEFNNKYGNLKILREKGTRAKAREVGIRNVETEWFMFVDSDVILCKDWYKKARKYVDSDVGAVWGINIDMIPNFKSRIFYKLALHIAKETFKIRGGMHDTLILHEAVKDIKIPEYLHAYEDAYIINWVKGKGYRVVMGDDIYCLHYRPPEDWYLKESLSLVETDIRCALAYSRLYKYAIYYPFFVIYWILFNSPYVIYWILQNIQRIKNNIGYINGGGLSDRI
jgi:glycosyltransferase involved in cell wall biosynthesis